MHLDCGSVLSRLKPDHVRSLLPLCYHSIPYHADPSNTNLRSKPTKNALIVSPYIAGSYVKRTGDLNPLLSAIASNPAFPSTRGFVHPTILLPEGREAMNARPQVSIGFLSFSWMNVQVGLYELSGRRLNGFPMSLGVLCQHDQLLI